ncbi:hypothetical protein SAMN02745116_02181 [Pilibacter termitis]|uniref:DUF951 domain-containing protein n=1 Tax=Pilibacter termitis TaxID=263852 RepID=A0A1T4QFS2_9ENTE|nr:hypothetical protein SAMN02745116_02181 [Pilibacter termitis]
MKDKAYGLGDIVEMKKPHACTLPNGKKANAWKIVRLGADIKIECTNCNRLVMMKRVDFNKRLKRVLTHAEESEKEAILKKKEAINDTSRKNFLEYRE